MEKQLKIENNKKRDNINFLSNYPKAFTEKGIIYIPYEIRPSVGLDMIVYTSAQNKAPIPKKGLDIYKDPKTSKKYLSVDTNKIDNEQLEYVTQFFSSILRNKRESNIQELAIGQIIYGVTQEKNLQSVFHIITAIKETNSQIIIKTIGLNDENKKHSYIFQKNSTQSVKLAKYKVQDINGHSTINIGDIIGENSNGALNILGVATNCHTDNIVLNFNNQDPKDLKKGGYKKVTIPNMPANVSQYEEID